jgi:KAP family P-loop domain
MAAPPNYPELVRSALQNDNLNAALNYLGLAFNDDEKRREIEGLLSDLEKIEAETVEAGRRKGGSVSPELLQKRNIIHQRAHALLRELEGGEVEFDASNIAQSNTMPNIEQVQTQSNSSIYDNIAPLAAKEVLGGLAADADANYDISNKETRRTDRLNIMYDVDAFANLIAYKGLQPPLAIGLFGQWGSGKSFFMEKLREQIFDKAQLAAKEKAASPFHKNIVQVTFNAWHYNEENLWASLVATIFGSLAAHANPNVNANNSYEISAQLERELAAYTAESSAKEVELNKLKVALEKNEDEAIHRFGNVILSDAKEMWDMVKTEKPFKKVAENLHLDSNMTWDEAHKQMQASKTAFGKLQKTALMLWQNPKILGIVAVLMLMPFILPDIIGSFCDLMRWNNQNLIDWSKNIAMIIPPIIAFLNYIKPYWSDLTKYVGFFETELGQIKAEKTVFLEKIKAENTSLKDKIKATETALADLRNGNRLLGFIQDTAQSDNYSKYLGIITMIRNDFAQLQTEMSFLKGKYPDFSIDRIVLYIDDLDRCPEQKVVEVLEAVHMLLGLDLFVVVVGVDPRWVKKALHNQMGLRLEDGDKTGLITATAYDYLEKIFQVPFRLNALNPVSTSKLVEFLLDANTKEGGTATFNSRDIGSEKPTEEALPIAESETDIAPSEAEESPAPTLPELKITTDEVAWIQALAPLISTTPRSVKRFANIYRILRVHQQTPIFCAENHDVFKAIILLLAIATGANSSRMEELIKWCQQNPQKTLHNTNETAFSVLHQSLFENIPSETVLLHADLVRKFTFRESENMEKKVGF